MIRPARAARLVSAALLVALLASCGADRASSPEGGDRPTIVVTTSVLGDVVSRMVDDAARVEVLMAPGADPHDVSLSAREAIDVGEADALITNGAGFEEGMADGLEAAESDGVPSYEAISAVDSLSAREGDGTDPHFFTDPVRMALAADGIKGFLSAQVPALATDAFEASASAEVEDLRALDQQTEAVLSVVAAGERTLVTNHESLAYFADRYDFEVVGTVIPGGGTGAQPSAGDLAELAEVIERQRVAAIFADVSSPDALAEALADEVGDVEVVELFTESLGPEGSPGATYDGMVQTNAERIAAALG